MTNREIKHPEMRVPIAAYSAGLLRDGWLYVSGMASLDFRSGEFLLGTVEEETVRTLEHIEKIVQAAGASMANVVKCTVHLNDIGEFGRFNQAYAEFFGSRGFDVLPARTTVQSILAENLKVEIDAIARVEEQKK